MTHRFPWSRGVPEASGVSGHQRGEVDETQQRRLQQLNHRQRPFNPDQGDAGKDDRSFGNGGEHEVLGGHFGQIFEEGGIRVGRKHALQILDVAFGVRKLLQEFETVLEPGENGEFSLEGILAEIQVENGRIFGLAGFPIGVSHRELVEVRQQRLNHRRLVAEN